MLSAAVTSNRLVEAHLKMEIEKIEQVFEADCLSYIGSILSGVDDLVRNAVEGIAKTENKRNKLLFLLETDGGYAETTRRISDTLRHHYAVVEFLIPNYAMSAGTILAMSGDAIHMDYYSVLGPIDPQVPGPDGRFIPALGYLVRYEELLSKAQQGKASNAELRILINFDQGQLYSYEQARDLSLSLLEEWLVKYKFKDWYKTEDRGKPVSEAMKIKRAKEVARKLNDVRFWNSHGIGINIERLRRDLKLKIDDFGADPKLKEPIRLYHGLLTDYMARMSQTSVVHTRLAYQPVM